MGILSRWIKKKKKTSRDPTTFGRFSDAYKSEDQYASWDRAEELFRGAQPGKAIEEFLTFLSPDESTPINVSYEAGEWHFEIVQGSARVQCILDKQYFVAEAGLVKTNQAAEELLDHLLQVNYHLKYARYAWDKEGNIKLKFDSFVEDLNNYKLYYALRELALLADQKDDVLLHQWQQFEGVDNDHLRDFDQELKWTRTDFIRHELQSLISGVQKERFRDNELTNVVTYMILSTVYKIDFLAQPQGQLMELINDTHAIFYQKKQESRNEQNRRALENIKRIAELDRSTIEKELYVSNQVFGRTESIGRDALISFIQKEKGQLRWFDQREYRDVVEAIYGFIVGHILYCYAPPLPIRMLLESWYHINHPEYYRLHGHDVLKPQKKGLPNGIKSMYLMMEREFQKEYPNVDLNLKEVDFKHSLEVIHWILEEIIHLDLSKTAPVDE